MTYVDEANEHVRIFDLEYRPSEVLFAWTGGVPRALGRLRAGRTLARRRRRDGADDRAAHIVSGSDFTESVVEEAALAWLEALGYACCRARHRRRRAPRRAQRPELPRRRPGAATAPGARAPQPRPAARGAGRRLPQADARPTRRRSSSATAPSTGCWSMA